MQEYVIKVQKEADEYVDLKMHIKNTKDKKIQRRLSSIMSKESNEFERQNTE